MPAAILSMGVMGGGPTGEGADRLSIDPSISWSQLQFTFLEGFARGDDGLLYAWEVQTEQALAAELTEVAAEGDLGDRQFRDAVRGAGHVSVAGAGACRILDLRSKDVGYTRLLVDVPSFGYNVLGAMVKASPAVRARIFRHGFVDDDTLDET